MGRDTERGGRGRGRGRGRGGGKGGRGGGKGGLSLSKFLTKNTQYDNTKAKSEEFYKKAKQWKSYQRLRKKILGEGEHSTTLPEGAEVEEENKPKKRQKKEKEKVKTKEEIEAEVEARQRKIARAKLKRREETKRLQAKTRKGQPVMKNQIDSLLEKLQAKKAAKANN